MGDGDHVSGSSYENRTVEAELMLIEDASEEWAAEEMQKLWRELDRPSNFLLYQPDGLDEPVFFRLFRSDVSDLEELWTVPIARRITLELLAEPFALGLRETLGPYTVNNDPAHARNPCYFDVTGVLGDVAVPAVFVIDPSSSVKTAVLAKGASLAFGQFESASPMTVDTTNIGGGPDAVMSGAGTNNFLRTTFASGAALGGRVQTSVGTTVEAGSYRLLVAVRRSDNTSVMRVAALQIGTVVEVPKTTNRQLVDLGVYTTRSSMGAVGFSDSPNASDVMYDITFQAARDSGSGTLDWDYYLLVPASESFMALNADQNTNGFVVDGLKEKVDPWYSVSGGDPVLGTASSADSGVLVGTAGGFPRLDPDQTNRLHFLQSDVSGHVKARTASVAVHIWPRYLFVRPSAS
jgi:hypothetical protein